MVDQATRKSLSGIPLLKTKAGPRDKELWVQRLKEEFQALIKYVETNKQQDNDWFRLESNKEGTRWFGKCWYIQDLLKYEFEVEFDVSLICFLLLLAFLFLNRSCDNCAKQRLLVTLSCKSSFSSDPCDLSNYSTRNCSARIRWKNCQNVQRREDLFD